MIDPYHDIRKIFDHSFLSEDDKFPNITWRFVDEATIGIKSKFKL